MIDKLLIISEQAEDKHFSLEKGAHLAKLYDAEVVVVKIIAPTSKMNTTAGLAQQKSALAAAAASFFDKPLHVLVLVTDDIAASVNEVCIKESIDLVIKTGNRSESLFHTPLDWQLIRQLAAPILILNEHKWRKSATVLATVDMSDKANEGQLALNKDVVDWSYLLADKMNLDFNACYIEAVSTIANDMDLPTVTTPSKEQLTEIKHRFAQLSDRLAPVADKLFITPGVPQKEIPSYASKVKADIVVMGSICRQGIKGFLLGNTAEQVLKNLRTDVLILRP